MGKTAPDNGTFSPLSRRGIHNGQTKGDPVYLYSCQKCEFVSPCFNSLGAALCQTCGAYLQSEEPSEEIVYSRRNGQAEQPWSGLLNRLSSNDFSSTQAFKKKDNIRLDLADLSPTD